MLASVEILTELVWTCDRTSVIGEQYWLDMHDCTIRGNGVWFAGSVPKTGTLQSASVYLRLLSEKKKFIYSYIQTKEI